MPFYAAPWHIAARCEFQVGTRMPFGVAGLSTVMEITQERGEGEELPVRADLTIFVEKNQRDWP